MQLIYTEGCICDSLSIDNVESIDIPMCDFKKVLHKLINRESDISTLQQVYMSLMSSQGEYECSDRPCECCGDLVRTYSLEIE